MAVTKEVTCSTCDAAAAGWTTATDAELLAAMPFLAAECNACGGSGRELTGIFHDCPECKGTGKVFALRPEVEEG